MSTDREAGWRGSGRSRKRHRPAGDGSDHRLVRRAEFEEADIRRVKSAVAILPLIYAVGLVPDGYATWTYVAAFVSVN